MDVAEYVCNLKEEIKLLREELEDAAATIGNIDYLIPKQENRSRYSSVEKAVLEREQLEEKLLEVQKKLIIALRIINEEESSIKAVEDGRVITIARLCNKNDEEINATYLHLSRKRFKEADKAFQEFFFYRLRELNANESF